MNMMGLFQSALKENTQREVCLRLNADPLLTVHVLGLWASARVCRCRRLRPRMCGSACDYGLISQVAFIQKKTLLKPSLGL